MSALRQLWSMVRERTVKGFRKARLWLVPSAPPANEPSTLPPPQPAILPAPVEPDIKPVLSSPVPRPKRTATQTKPDAETLSDLLDGLEDSFQSLVIPEIKRNWLTKSDVRAIHKIGIYIPSPWFMENPENPSIPAGMQLPMAASALMIQSSGDTDEWLHPRFAFLLKESKLPHTVEQVRGIPFKFGYCVQLRPTEKRDEKESGMFWMWAWVVVTPDRRIVIPSELRTITRQIFHGKKSGSRGVDYVHMRQWQRPQLIQPHDGHTTQHLQNILILMFRQLVVWWMTREERWSVSVRREAKRITFSIAKEHTAAYFADRDKQVTADGQTKKIVHYVRAHTRANGSHVKEHVRGLREFQWRNFECKVVAPRLSGALFTDAPLSPIDVPESMLKTSKDLTTEQAAELLANVEDGLETVDSMLDKLRGPKQINGHTGSRAVH